MKKIHCYSTVLLIVIFLLSTAQCYSGYKLLQLTSPPIICAKLLFTDNEIIVFNSNTLCISKDKGKTWNIAATFNPKFMLREVNTLGNKIVLTIFYRTYNVSNNTFIVDSVAYLTLNTTDYSKEKLSIKSFYFPSGTQGYLQFQSTFSYINTNKYYLTVDFYNNNYNKRFYLVELDSAILLEIFSGKEYPKFGNLQVVNDSVVFGYRTNNIIYSTNNGKNWDFWRELYFQEKEVKIYDFNSNSYLLLNNNGAYQTINNHKEIKTLFMINGLDRGLINESGLVVAIRYKDDGQGLKHLLYVYNDSNLDSIGIFSEINYDIGKDKNGDFYILNNGLSNPTIYRLVSTASVDHSNFDDKITLQNLIKLNKYNNCKITLINYLGQIISQYSIEDFELDKLEPGLYYILVETSCKTYFLKQIIY